MNILHKYTRKTLLKNRIRTIVTIVGIILSTAMITAVTSSITSLQKYMLNIVSATDGVWNGVIRYPEQERKAELEQNKEIEQSAFLQNIGYARLENAENENKPYLFVAGYSEKLTDLIPLYLSEGRMPQNEGEVIIPDHLASNGGIVKKIGETITVGLGNRVAEDGTVLWQDVMYGSEEYPKEHIEKKSEVTYKIVGIYQRSELESYSAPGYMMLTVPQKDTGLSSSFYFTIKNPKKTGEFLDQNCKDGETSAMNTMFLTYSGYSGNDSFNAVLYSLAAILIGIIMFGSISLIYNSFSISVNERKKQFGLLSSIGATKKQLRGSILYESSLLSLVGIPIGILAGLGGMAVTFKCMEGLFEFFTSNTVLTDIKLQLEPSFQAIGVASIVAFVTVLISAYLPARRALKISAIEAIRQNDDVRIRARKIKTSRLTKRLFGLEGVLANKNFKRNKRKYRATVFSLFISIVLFISASSFCDYLSTGVNGVYDAYQFDLSYTSAKRDDSLYKELSEAKNVTGSNRINQFGNVAIRVTNENLTKDFFEYSTFEESDKKEQELMGYLIFVEDAVYEAYLSQNGLDKEIYMNASHPTALAMDYIQEWDENGSKYNFYHVMGKENIKVKVAFPTKEGDFKDEIEVQMGESVDKYPLGVDMYGGGQLCLMLPWRVQNQILPEGSEYSSYNYFFSSSNPKATYEEMCHILKERGQSTSSIFNVDEMLKSNQALLTIINIFSYGFIILISLIAAANVFNTISTNIHLRRREFAMLKSIGMTQKGFYRMMNFECLLYGLKGICYGVPVAFVITWLIFQSISEGINMNFYIPWYSIVIAIGSVFGVVFATMLYSMRKFRKQNTIDALKNENI